jgi:glucose/arabinose dehydrogenase
MAVFNALQETMMLKKCVLTMLTLALSLSAVIAAEEEPAPEVAVNPMQVDPHEYLDRIELPPGFQIEIYADNILGPRAMVSSPSGVLFVGTSFVRFGEPPIGKVYAVLDNDGDKKADEIITIAEGLNHPNGVALRDGALYVAEINRILRYDDIEANLHNPPEPVVVYDGFPTDVHHGWKFIAFGPDDRLYVPVGAPCNICEPEPPYSSITSMKPDGSDLQIYARGIRNSVGFDWHPVTKELWFTDNGRDLWGSNRPPEELNHAPEPGLHFGFPYRYGRNLVDDTYPTTMTDADFTPATVELPAHNAPLGARFYTGKSFPAEYQNQIFIAHHGSWNRNPPDGYLISLVRLRDNAAPTYEVFASGWLIDEKYWGRPSYLEIMADGSLLVSDDFANVIYRISYSR